MIGIAAVGRNEFPHDFGVVNPRAGLGFETKAPAGGEDDLLVAVARKHDIVVENAENVHDVPSDQPAIQREISRTTSPGLTSMPVFGVTLPSAAVFRTVIIVTVLKPAALTLSKSTVTSLSPALTR